jgi:hypothetical protein
VSTAKVTAEASNSVRWGGHRDLNRILHRFLTGKKKGSVTDSRCPCGVTPSLSPDAQRQESGGVRHD